MGVVGGCVYNRENLLVNSDVAITHTTPVRTYTCIYHLYCTCHFLTALDILMTTRTHTLQMHPCLHDMHIQIKKEAKSFLLEIM